MAIVSIKEVSQPRQSHFRVGENEQYYQRQWTVVTDDKNDGPRTVRAAFVATTGIDAGVVYNTGYESDSAAHALGIEATCTAIDGKQWTITVNYGRWPSESHDTNPLMEPYEVSWDFQQFERPTDYDVFNQPVVNSAGFPFEEPVMIDDSRPVLTVTRNELVFNYALANYYKDSVNLDPFFGAPPYCVKCSSISSQRVYDQWMLSHLGTPFYWKTTYQFHFRVDGVGFKTILLDQGLKEFDTTTGKHKNIMINGTPVSAPHPLNGSGVRLPVGAPYQWRTYYLYYPLPFSAFGF